MHRSNILPQIVNWNRKEFNLETHLLFIDYEKAFDNKDISFFIILEFRHITDTSLTAKVDIYTKKQNIDKI